MGECMADSRMIRLRRWLERRSRATRIAVLGAALIVIAYCGAITGFSVLGKNAFPADDFTFLITLPPWPADKFWYTTFGGRNVEVRTTEEFAAALRAKVAHNIATHGYSWRFKKIVIVGHGGPGYLIFDLGKSVFKAEDTHIFTAIRDFADADTEIVIRCCSMLKDRKGFGFISALARASNCTVTAWSDVGMYNGLVQLGDRYSAFPDGSVEPRREELR